MALCGYNVFPFAWVGDFVHVQQRYAVQDGILRHFEIETHPHTQNILTRKSAAELRYTIFRVLFEVRLIAEEGV